VIRPFRRVRGRRLGTLSLLSRDNSATWPPLPVRSVKMRYSSNGNCPCPPGHNPGARDPVGFPDFLRGVRLYGGHSYCQWLLAPGEKWKIFLAVFPPDNPLPSGQKAALIDLETNMETPWEQPAGYYGMFVEWAGFMSDTHYLHIYLDDRLLATFTFPFCPYYHEYERIIWASTEFTDPEAEYSHKWHFEVENPTPNDLVGSVHVALIVRRKVGA